MGNRLERVICVFDQDSRATKKIFKVSIASDGSIFVFVPYFDYSSQTPFLYMKAPISRERLFNIPGEFQIPNEIVVKFRANADAKLSHHPDGFIHFSSSGPAKIISGKDEFDKPKGAGIFTWSLDRPAMGPSYGCSVWGISHLKDFKVSDKRNLLIEDIIQHPSENKIINAPKEDYMTVFELFYIKNQYPSGRIMYDGGNLLMDHPIFGWVKMKTIPLEEGTLSKGLLGIFVRRLYSPANVRNNSDFGFSLSGPTGSLHSSDDFNSQELAWNLHCTYDMVAEKNFERADPIDYQES